MPGSALTRSLNQLIWILIKEYEVILLFEFKD
jgi:hypothetical protein